MKKVFTYFMFFLLLSGMGIFPEDESKLPDVVTNYKMIIIDRDGFSVEITNATINGLLYLSGKLNKGDMLLSFKDIDRVYFEPIDEKKVESKVFLKNGETIILTLNGNLKVKGRSKYGVYSILLKDTKEIKVTGIVTNKKNE